MSTIQERVHHLVSAQLGVKLEDVKDEDHLIDDLGADSLDTVELVMAVEEEFDMEISDEDAEKLMTVNEVVEFVTANT